MQAPSTFAQLNNSATLQATIESLGGSFKGAADASLLAWAQAAHVGNANEDRAGSAVAAALVQRLDWQELAFSLPGKFSNCSTVQKPGPAIT